LKVVIINHFAGVPKVNEASLRHYNFAKYFQKKKIDCSIITSKKNYQKYDSMNYSEDSIGDIEYLFVDEPIIKSKSLFAKLTRMVGFSFNLYKYLFFKKNFQKIDYVIASSPDLFTAFVGYLFAKKKSSKFILEIRDIWPLSQIELHNFSRNHPMIILLKYLENLLHRKADIIISNLPYYEKYLIDHNMPHKEYFYIPQVIDKEYYYENYQKIKLNKEHLKIFKTYDFVGIYSGTIGKYYGIKNIIEALRLIDKKMAIILMGEGDFKNDAIKLKKEYSLDNLFIIDGSPKSYLFSILDKCSFGIVSFQDKKIYKYGIASLKMFDYLYAQIPLLMMGPFSKYSILKNINIKYKTRFLDIDGIVNQFNRLYEINKQTRLDIAKESHQLLDEKASISLMNNQLDKIFPY
jgi:hypothetical protein